MNEVNTSVLVIDDEEMVRDNIEDILVPHRPGDVFLRAGQALVHPDRVAHQHHLEFLLHPRRIGEDTVRILLGKPLHQCATDRIESRWLGRHGRAIRVQ